MGHFPDYRKGGEAFGRKYSDDEECKTPDRVHGHPVGGGGITVYWMPVDICKDRMEVFFSKYGEVEEVNPASQLEIVSCK